MLPTYSELVAHAPKMPDLPWHGLAEHLQEVGRMAAHFVAPFADSAWGRIGGEQHDLGKAARGWQIFIREAGAQAFEAHLEGTEGVRRPPGRRFGPDHSTAGAIHVRENLPGTLGAVLAFVIAGHHGGLSNKEALWSRLNLPEKRDGLDAARVQAPSGMLDLGTAPAAPGWMRSLQDEKAQMRSWEFFIRMLFSAVVDADFLDTEAYFATAGSTVSAAQVEARARVRISLETLRPLLDAHLERMAAGAEPTVVNQLRQEVLVACREAAKGPRGAFTLTAPTGIGKTFSSLAFAMDHAITHGASRIVVVVPFTSIIDQTARDFREALGSLGDLAVLEHHSAVDPDAVSVEGRMAAENWEAPIVVTTQVQFFESLFACRTSACRKLHNLAGSVIVLDEVQSLPCGFLEPVLEALQELVAHYGVSLLMTTATQPALERHTLSNGKVLPGLVPEPTPLLPEALQHRVWERLRRVRVHWPEARQRPAEADTFWGDLATRMCGETKALTITHQKKDAQALWRQLVALDPSALHLSASMCAAHRIQVLKEIQRRLKAKSDGACRVASTQVLEAGIQVDFPVVFREMAGLESLAQTAGRCNREGLLDWGHLHVFTGPSHPPPGLELHLETAWSLLNEDPKLNLFRPETFRAYFDALYRKKEWDVKGIQPKRSAFAFEDVAERFRLIDEGCTIFVPYGPARQLLDQLREGVNQDLLRCLQPYTVSVRQKRLEGMKARGEVQEVATGLWELCGDTLYHEQLGLLEVPEPGQLWSG